MDFTKTCWCCGENTMEPFDGYYACQECGATWNEVPKVSGQAVVEEKVMPWMHRDRSARRLKGVGKRIKKRRKKDAVNI